MRINILCYEPRGGWILWDMAHRLKQEFDRMGVKSELSDKQLEGFDITYHINYAGLRAIEFPSLHCTMVTHIDEPWKFELVNKHAKEQVHGICLSDDTSRHMRGLTGVANFIGIRPPAMLEPRKERVSVLFSSSVYPDGRKNEGWVRDFCQVFDPDVLRLTVMGLRWDAIVGQVRAAGYQVDHYAQFDRTRYVELLDATDYVLYTGQDEGAISVADAVARGVKAIASAQGFHLELGKDVILFANRPDLVRVARIISDEVSSKNARMKAASDWRAYAQKHVEYWSGFVATSSSRGAGLLSRLREVVS